MKRCVKETQFVFLRPQTAVLYYWGQLAVSVDRVNEQEEGRHGPRREKAGNQTAGKRATPGHEGLLPHIQRKLGHPLTCSTELPLSLWLGS